jgi:hypothetical protein
MTNLYKTAIPVILLAFSTSVLGGNFAITTLKTAKFSITKQVTTAGIKSTVTVSKHDSFDKAIEAVKLLAPGSYRIIVPSPYVTVIACPPITTQGVVKQPVCLDQTDTRLIP